MYSVKSVHVHSLINEMNVFEIRSDPVGFGLDGIQLSPISDYFLIVFYFWV